RAFFKSLFRAWFFQVKHLVLHFRKSRELMLRRGEERYGDITVDIMMQPALEHGQDMAGEPSSPRPYFQDTQTPAFGKLSRSFAHGGSDGSQPMAGEQAVAVELIQQFGSMPGEQHLHGILFAPQDGSEFRACCRDQLAFRQVARTG